MDVTRSYISSPKEHMSATQEPPLLLDGFGSSLSQYL